MYIRRVKFADGDRYVLRETYRDRDVWRHRDILDLGASPGEFIEYPGGRGYYFHENLEEALQAQQVNYTTDDLEKAFLPFMRHDVRSVIERFQCRGTDRTADRWRKCPSGELLDRQKELHSFDKRRLHYLRCGRIDIGELEGRPWKFLNVLLDKSRDEIEHTLETMETVLRPQEVKAYVFTAFNLQAHFPHHLTRNHPWVLDREKLDSLFLEQVCRVNGDPGFFRGVAHHDPDVLHGYLAKYLILYFDHDFDGDVHDDWLENFMRRGRPWRRQPAGAGEVSAEEACAILGISTEECGRMDRGDLMRLYREKAKEVHPDMGGDHESFLKVKKAYEALLLRK